MHHLALMTGDVVSGGSTFWSRSRTSGGCPTAGFWKQQGKAVAACVHKLAFSRRILVLCGTTRGSRRCKIHASSRNAASVQTVSLYWLAPGTPTSLKPTRTALAQFWHCVTNRVPGGRSGRAGRYCKGPQSLSLCKAQVWAASWEGWKLPGPCRARGAERKRMDGGSNSKRIKGGRRMGDGGDNTTEGQVVRGGAGLEIVGVGRVWAERKRGSNRGWLASKCGGWVGWSAVQGKTDWGGGLKICRGRAREAGGAGCGARSAAPACGDPACVHCRRGAGASRGGGETSTGIKNDLSRQAHGVRAGVNRLAQLSAGCA